MAAIVRSRGGVMTRSATARTMTSAVFTGRGGASFAAPDAVASAGKSSVAALLTAVICADTLGRLHEMLPYGDRIPIAKVLLPLGLFAVLAGQGAQRRLRALATPQAIAFMIFCLAIVITIPTSLMRGASFKYMVTFSYTVVPYVVILAAGPATARDLRLICRGIAAAVICVGAVMMLQGGYSEGGRISAGGTYDPNDIALVAVVCLPFATSLFRERSWFWRLFGAAAAGAAMLIVVLSASRGGLIAAGVVLLFMIVRARYSLSKTWKLLIVPAAAIALAMAPPVFWARVTTLGDMSSDYNVTSDGGRVQIWKRGFKTFVGHPIVGVGGGQFAVADGMSPDRVGADDQSWHTAHNSIIQIAVELGVVGLIGFFGLHVPTLRAARGARRAAESGRVTPEMAALGETLFLAIIGFQVAGMFLSAGDSYAFFTLGALGMSYTAMLRGGVGAPPAATRPIAESAAAGWRSARRFPARAASTRNPDRALPLGLPAPVLD
jgi:O-antigen ligase